MQSDKAHAANYCHTYHIIYIYYSLFNLDKNWRVSYQFAPPDQAWMAGKILGSLLEKQKNDDMLRFGNTGGNNITKT